MATVGYTQTGRALRIDTPLETDKLLLRTLSGQEGVSQLFRFQLDLLSEDDEISFDDIVGKNVTVHIETADGERGLNGFISRFSQGSRDERFTYYRAEMVPWLWFLTRTADCRIFQKKTAPVIIQKIFDDLDFKDYDFRLKGNFRTRDYCVQYRETDFNFVSRLMEEEGICYFFEHSEDGTQHILVLSNDGSSHHPCPNQPKASCDFSPGIVSEDLITEWRLEEEFRPNAWAHTDYNFETPSSSLMAHVKDDGKKYEIYDYPGVYLKKGDGDALAKTRLQETVAFKNRASGKSTCRNFNAGSIVEVTDHYRKDVNKKWMLTSVHHQCSMGSAYDTSGSGEGFFYTNTFECVPAEVLFRPLRLTPKPNVQGCQTAVVVGPGGEEIYTDKYSRVKVQFYWDREGKKNEDSSCWIRVSSPWAGKSWGGIHIPRIGQEVIVDFLEGDPDQPLIVGRVYNAEQMPPWALPAKKVISGFKSDSTKGSGGYNEISMDDTKGTELIQVHAQFDQDIKVEHDERLWVGRNETIQIGHDRQETVGHDERILIKHDKTEVVNNDRSLQVDRDKSETVVRNKVVQIGGNHSENIDGAMSIVVGGTLSESVLVNIAQSVAGAMEITVGAALAITAGGVMAETVGGIKTETIGGNKAENIGGNKTLMVAKDYTHTIAGNESVKIAKDLTSEIGGQHQEQVTKEYMLTAKKVQVTAEEEIHLKTGDAEIILKKNGNISIKGNKINVEGSGDVVIKGSKIKAN